MVFSKIKALKIRRLPVFFSAIKLQNFYDLDYDIFTLLSC